MADLEKLAFLERPLRGGLSVCALVAVHESLTGPFRQMLRRSDLAAIGGQADIQRTSLI